MSLPSEFIYLQDVDSSINQDMRYFSENNFMGARITGYEAAVCITLRKIAAALSDIQKQLAKQSLGLKVFDCYRPQMAVDEFVVWSQNSADQKMKHLYYPNVNKADFFKLGYISNQSAHTRGSAVDLTIIELETQQELNMGTRFDFMDEMSHSLTERVQGEARKNRLLLRKLMMKAGFEPLETEWWHFRYINEPFPETYFNFPVK